jgi:putative FmdB family regulatory protein
MPIYEYMCEKCSHEFEREQRITDDPVKTCPKCRSRRVKKLISQTSFVLKGGGWYSDLYSSSGKDAKKTSDSEKSSGDSGSSSDKSDKDSSSSKDSKDSSAKSADKGGKGSKSKASKKNAA